MGMLQVDDSQAVNKKVDGPVQGGSPGRILHPSMLPEPSVHSLLRVGSLPISRGAQGMNFLFLG